ncbi:MAG: HlyD family efflux transporter periplasmic adaptor subunit, partial [Planctomycetaceae bacterium]|nr:HlyD family efflux transporter periplasmic adaptor subunit [Planctomycetaceae bacterium]
MRKRVWIIAAFAAIISGWMAMQPSPVSVDVAHVERGTMLLTVTDDGRTRIREKYTVSAPLAARLVRIDLEPGDRIEAGETPLAVLQPTNPALLDPRELAEARARASSAEARLNQLEPRLTLAKEKLNFAESELGRLRQLEARKSTSSNEVDAAELEFDSASANYSDVVFAQEIAAFELQLAKAALEHTAIDGSADATDSRQLPIVAPITGQVLRVFQESATVVTPGEPLLEIGDPSDLEVEVDVLSTDAVRIRPGAAVFLENWGGAEALHGKVRLVEP